jgi:peptidoglycan/LPS O-acetylase OafA/YrhL
MTIETEPQAVTTTRDQHLTPSDTGSLAYSPALDGLRAVAVVAVLLYHLSLPWVRGGFLGVDLFFVLSGFLITSLLVREYQVRGTIRLGAFWARRVRRLLPAALLVILAVCVCWALTATSDQVWSVRHDALWTLGYAANWHFVLSGQSYFAQFSAPSPLLHTWSLAIEEQFYVVWPLLVLLLLRWRRGRLWVLTAVALAGAACSAALMRHEYHAAEPSRVYYGTDTRAHELLAGAVLALLLAGPLGDRLRPWLRRLAVPAALAVLVALILMPDTWPWYYRGAGLVFGFVAAVLVAGVYAGGPAGAPLARLLGVRPLAWLGRISYGLYLWHWPVYQALNESSTHLSSPALDVARIAVALLIAVVSFYLVEQPVRRGRPLGFRLSPRRLAVAAPVAIGVAAVLVFSSTTGATKPLLVDDGPQFKVLVGQQGLGGYTIGFAGDSVARLTAPGLVDIAKRNGWGLVNAAFDGCSVGGLELADAQDNESTNHCSDKVATAQTRLVNGYSPSVIFVYSRWDLNTAYGPDHALPGGTAAQEKVVVDRWRTALTRLTSRGATVVWLDLTPAGPEVCRSVGGVHAKGCRIGDDDPANRLMPTYNALFRQVARGFGGKVLTIPIWDLLCTDPTCTVDKPGAPLRVDGLHFDGPNAARFAPMLLERARQAGAPIPRYQP